MSDFYVTIDELRAAPYSITAAEADDDYLGILQNITKEMIDNVCKQSFLKEGSTEEYVEKKFDGNGEDTLFINPYRLVTLEKVRIYYSTLTYYDYDTDDIITRTRSIKWKMYSDLSSRYRIESFPVGISNIGVFAVWGWSSVPSAISYLQGKIIQKMVSDKTMGNNMESEKIGDYSYKRLSEGGKYFGDKELDSIVQQYRRLRFAAI